MNYEAFCGAKYGTLSSGDRGGVGFEALIRSKGRRRWPGQKSGTFCIISRCVSRAGPLRELNLRSGQPPSAAHSCATASSSAIALVLPPAAEDAAAAEPSRAAPRRSSRARRAPGTMTTACLKRIRAAFLRAFVPPRTHPFCQAVVCGSSDRCSFTVCGSFSCTVRWRCAHSGNL